MEFPTTPEVSMARTRKLTQHARKFPLFSELQEDEWFHFKRSKALRRRGGLKIAPRMENGKLVNAYGNNGPMYVRPDVRIEREIRTPRDY